MDCPLDGVRNGMLTGKKLNIVVNDAEKEKTAALVWFRNDLRVRDQHSLSNAIAKHEQVIGLYHIPIEWLLPTPWGFKKMERYRAKFLLQTLMQLKKN